MKGTDIPWTDFYVELVFAPDCQLTGVSHLNDGDIDGFSKTWDFNWVNTVNTLPTVE